MKEPDYDVAIVTYWTSFEQHEKSHADKTFNDKFSALAEMCSDTFELVSTCSGKAYPANKTT
ncbi:MAG: hypothetical protein R6W97_04330 [Thiobacillus sp.]